MDTEDQILKGTKLITNTQKQRLKIQSRGQTLRKIVLKIQNRINHKNYKKNIYMIFALKRGHFLQGNSKTNENQRNNKELKFKKIKKW